jgi:hypothetical protein
MDDEYQFFQMATGGAVMTEGRHYWEVEIMVHADPEGDDIDFRHAGTGMFFGAVRPDRDHNEHIKIHDQNAYVIGAAGGGIGGPGSTAGGLHGQGMSGFQAQGPLVEGDRIGCLLDLDAGWLRFYCNGKRCGPGFGPVESTGEVVRGAGCNYYGRCSKYSKVTGPLVRVAGLVRVGDTAKILPDAVAPEGAGAADEPWEPHCARMKAARQADAMRQLQREREKEGSFRASMSLHDVNVNDAQDQDQDQDRDD